MDSEPIVDALNDSEPQVLKAVAASAPASQSLRRDSTVTLPMPSDESQQPAVSMRPCWTASSNPAAAGCEMAPREPQTLGASFESHQHARQASEQHWQPTNPGAPETPRSPRFESPSQESSVPHVVQLVKMVLDLVRMTTIMMMKMFGGKSNQ